MSSTQHQLIEQCAARLRGIVEALDNIHDTSPQRWSTDLDDVHSSAESLLALINDQAPTLDSQGLAGTALAQPSPKCTTCNGTGQIVVSGPHYCGELQPPEYETESCDMCPQDSRAEADQAEAERQEMSSERAAYFMRRFKAEEKMLGPNEQAAVDYVLSLIAQHERIVGELRAVIAQLRQHKNDYMDSGQETYRALQNEIREREAEIARLDGLVSGRTAERDAALARVADLETELKDQRALCDVALTHSARLAKLEGQEPVALANRGLHAFWVKWTEAAAGLYGPGIKLYAHPVAQAQHSVPQAWLDVQAERRRQVTAEGWTPEHDDAHSHGQIARAAACYALAGSSAPNDGTAALLVSLAWPWDEQWWKPTSARRDLVKACALGLAEIERLDRAGITQSPQPGATTASS
ncbi:hypothetical protein [Pseudomonas aeruginosa]|uniref:hypothetical protein n=1 Tax=Pseudomonas aeruginosa TaxID=287 RepID=UPI00201820D2|nr:hypothetical protein [Pseudomonas aeruginosa]